MLGLEAFSYGINGNQMDGLLGQAENLLKEQGDAIDAIIVLLVRMIIMLAYLWAIGMKKNIVKFL